MNKNNSKLLCFIILLSCLFCSCTKTDQNRNHPLQIGVTSSYIECALRDLSGKKFEYIRLVPPGLCPAHFDINPGIIKNLKNSSLIIRFDFQHSVETKIRHLVGEKHPLREIRAPEGLCVPDSYRSCLKETYDTLIQCFPQYINDFDNGLKQTLSNLESLEKECHDKVTKAGLNGTKVIASGHQEVFCTWLGLDVVATYSGINASSPFQLKQIIDKSKESGIRFIIANSQEGKHQGDALSMHLDAPVILFSNFPNMESNQMSFMDLIRSNLHNLINAAEIKS